VRPPCHVAACLAAHRVGVVLVLDAHAPIQRGIVERGHVAGSIDIGTARPQELIHHDAVVHLQSRLPGQVHDWLDAQAGDDAIDNDLLAGGAQQVLLALSLEAGDLIPANTRTPCSW